MAWDEQMTTKEERDQAMARLREIARDSGYKFYTVLRHVSRSGMFRKISVYAMTREGKIWLDGYISHLGIYSLDKSGEGLRVSGCGMDMGFDVVYNVGTLIYPKGFRCHGKKCMGSEHHNPPFPPRDGRMHHKSGGYAIRQEWI